MKTLTKVSSLPSAPKLFTSLEVVLLLWFCTVRSAIPSELAYAPEVQVDVLGPIKADRHLETIDVHAFFAQKRFDVLPLVVMRFGLTLSRAYGSITQLVGNFDQGTLRAQTFASSAWGFGPIMQERLELFRGSGITLRADFGEAALWYGHDSQAGGDRTISCCRLARCWATRPRAAGSAYRSGTAGCMCPMALDLDRGIRPTQPRVWRSAWAMHYLLRRNTSQSTRPAVDGASSSWLQHAAQGDRTDCFRTALSGRRGQEVEVSGNCKIAHRPTRPDRIT